MNLQSGGIHNLQISELTLGNFEKKIHFNVGLIERSRIEEGGGLLPNSNYANVMNPKQIYNPKLSSFSLITYII